MKVLQLGKFYPILGGVEKVMYDLFTGLSTQGIQCDMLCADVDKSRKNTITKYIDSDSKLVICPTLVKLFATTIAPKMISELRKRCNHYDIIHVHHPDPMAALALYLSGFKGKVVLHWHSDILKQKFLLKFYMPLQKWLLERADLIIGTTPVYIKESSHLAKYQKKTTYLPIGIDSLSWDESSVSKIKEQYKGKKIIFSLGRLVPYKGFEFLIDAAKHINNDCVVLIGGSGPLREDLQKQIDQNNLQDKVKLIGRVNDDDLPNYYRASTVYCLSSIMKTEAFAIVQIEAMACGTPVVSTKIPGSGVAWVNADGESGLTVEPCDSEALGKALTKVLSDSDTHDKLSKGAKERFEKKFRKDEMIKNCLSIYNSLNV